MFQACQLTWPGHISIYLFCISVLCLLLLLLPSSTSTSITSLPAQDRFRLKLRVGCMVSTNWWHTNLSHWLSREGPMIYHDLFWHDSEKLKSQVIYIHFFLGGLIIYSDWSAICFWHCSLWLFKDCSEMFVCKSYKVKFACPAEQYIFASPSCITFKWVTLLVEELPICWTGCNVLTIYLVVLHRVVTNS